MFGWLKNNRSDWIFKGKIFCLSFVFDEQEDALVCAKYCQLQVGPGHGNESVALSTFCNGLQTSVAEGIPSIVWSDAHQFRAVSLSDTLINTYPLQKIIAQVEAEFKQIEPNLKLNLMSDDISQLQKQTNWYFDPANQQYYRKDVQAFF